MSQPHYLAISVFSLFYISLSQYLYRSISNFYLYLYISIFFMQVCTFYLCLCLLSLSSISILHLYLLSISSISIFWFYLNLYLLSLSLSLYLSFVRFFLSSSHNHLGNIKVRVLLFPPRPSRIPH